MKKIMIFIISVFSIFASSTMNVFAAQEKCGGDILTYYAENGTIKQENIGRASGCTCDGIDSKYKDSCGAMKSAMASGNIGYSINQIGTKYTVITKDTRNNAAYTMGLVSIVTIIKAVLNTIIGITLFLLGFGFLWNISKMGLHSSNPQVRQECLGKLGDIFGTALFLGAIPIIIQFVTGIIQNFQ